MVKRKGTQKNKGKIFSPDNVVVGLLFTSMVWFLDFAIDARVVHAEFQAHKVTDAEFSKLVTDTIPKMQVDIGKLGTNQSHILSGQSKIIEVIENMQ